MTITIRSTAQIVRGYAAAVQAATSNAVSFVLGSLELARANAVAGVTMWLLSKIMQVLALTRGSTSTGADLDSWMADFGIVTREVAVAAVGTVTFGRLTATTQVIVPAGATLKTADGTQSFTVIADTTQAAWNATQNAYVLPAGTASVAATVQAVTAGIGGNINAATLTQIASAVPGVDTVTNAAAFTSGVNAETDAALMARFQLTLQGLQKGIKAAVYAAIDGLQQGIQRQVVENQTLGGQTQYGYFYVIISPFNSTLQAQVYSAVDAVRPLTSTFGVFAATSLTANVAVTVTAASGYTHAGVAAAIQAAITSFIGGIALGAGLSWSELYAIVWGVPGVASATGLTVNSGTSDLAGVASQQIAAGTVTVS